MTIIDLQNKQMKIKYSVNVDKIAFISSFTDEGQKKTNIHFSAMGGDFIEVDETPDEIEKLIVKSNWRETKSKGSFDFT